MTIGEWECTPFGKGGRSGLKNDGTGNALPETIQTALDNRKEALMAKKKEKKAEKCKAKKKGKKKK